jgi:excisionase family DNA binding protein
MTTEPRQRLTVDEAAAITRESAFTIRKRCRDGVLPAAKHGRTWWIRRADLETYMAATNTTPTEPAPSIFMTASAERRRRTRVS